MSNRIISFAIPVLFISLFFKAYGEGRSMTETFGLNKASFFAGCFLVLLVYFLVVLLHLATMIVFKKSNFFFPKIFDVMFKCAIAGIAFAEIWISYDEWQFMISVRREHADKERKSRCFPFEGYDMLYDKGKGFWSID